MALFNYANREITAKVVYYGPGVCGKTTSLEYIHERISPAQRGRLLSLATETDRTIFFDLLPLKLGEIGGFKLRFQLYTVPGQVKYNKTRKLVLQGVDAIVFVADSQKNRREANIESFRNLQENLLAQNRNIEELPIVYEYNKRDLKDILSIEDLNSDLNDANFPHFPTIATKGVGVMETLEAISKHALQDMEQRLTAGSATSPVEEESEDELLLSESLMDLTEGEEESLSFSTEELGELNLESDLSAQGDELFSGDTLETRPIGYDNNVQVEEFEIRDEDVAQTGTLKESEFFNLKGVEEQALRELDEFLDGKTDTEEGMLDFALLDAPDDSPPASENDDEGFTAFSFNDDSPEDDEYKQPTNTFTVEDTSDLDFSLDSDAEEPDELSFDTDAESPPADFSENFDDLEFSLDDSQQEPEAESGLTFSLDAQPEEEALSFDIETSEPAFEEQAAALSAESESDDDILLGLNLDDESLDLSMDSGPSETSVKGGIESLDLSESDLDVSFDDQGVQESDDLPAFTLEEDGQGEASPLAIDDKDLISFSLDEDSTETGMDDLAPFDLSESSLNIPFGDAESASGVDASKETSSQEFDFSEFNITDSVRFEMQVGDEISSGTSFEQQLEQLSSSEELFTSEDSPETDEFQPELSETGEDEQFQIISDEWTRLLALSKYFYHRAEAFRAQHTTHDNILAIMTYHSAIETAVKAVASKYESCNPSLASFHLMLESIEEETGKTMAGVKSLRNNIVMMKNRIQLEAEYPDNEECELAARISERFLNSLAQDFLTIDFDKLSPVLPRAEG